MGNGNGLNESTRGYYSSIWEKDSIYLAMTDLLGSANPAVCI